VVVDAPYSHYVGSATDTEKAAFTGSGEGEKMLQQHQETRSRLVLTSGDSTGQTPDQSGFAGRFREALAQSGGADAILTYAEVSDWMKAGDSGIQDSYFGTNEAGANFLFIRKIAPATSDSLAWQAAQQADSCESYQHYWADYPDGKYREVAAQLIQAHCSQVTPAQASASDRQQDYDDWTMVDDNAPDINDFVFAEIEPKAINYDEVLALIGDPLQPFPNRGKTKNMGVHVVIRVLVDSRGNYVKHRVISQGHPLVANSVEQHVGKLIFTPAIQGGSPISFWVNLPFTFKRP
jgi:hypothetical protein